MGTDRILPPPINDLPVGSVIEQRQGGRTFLIVQESPGKRSIVESWDDLLDVSNRLLGRVKSTLDDMNADLAGFNQKLSRDLHETAAKIAANQRLVDELVKGPS